MANVHSIPNRDRLIQQLKDANRLAPLWIFLQLCGIAVVGSLIDWPRTIHEPIVPTIGIGLMAGSWALGVFRLWGQNKKEIGQLKESTRFGEFDKHILRSLFDDTLRRLGLPNDHVPVFITADKSLNASAFRLGMGGFFKSLNGVYLNRQVLHKLTAAEVQDIMGHELGHYYRYYILTDRFRFITLTLGSFIGVMVAQLTGLADIIGALILGGVASIFWWFSSLTWNRHGQAIEYLCDDFGSRVRGIEASINGLMKIGAEEELRYAIHAEMLGNKKKFGKLSAADIVESIEQAIPYGAATETELRNIVERELTEKSNSTDLSLTGFLKFAWQGDDDNDTIEEFQQTAAVLASIPRLSWESLVPDPSHLHFDKRLIERLVKLIEENPSHALFRLPDAAGSLDGIHPPLKDRILFLWYNRVG